MITKLKTELALPAYDGMTDQQALELLNAEFEVRQEYMLTETRLYNIIGLSVGAPLMRYFKDATDAVSEAIYRKLTTTGLDISNPETVGVVDMLVVGELITQGNADKVLAYGKTTTTRLKQIGVTRTINLDWIEGARA